MEFGLKITMADPAGNRTALVEGDPAPEHYAAIAAAILEDPDLRAEQAGFICPPVRGGLGRLNMMGGEFCGNAARSFGLLLAERRGKAGGSLIPVEISGSRDILNVFIGKEPGFASVSMPLPLGFIEVELPDGVGIAMDHTADGRNEVSPADIAVPALSLDTVPIPESGSCGRCKAASLRRFPAVVFEGITHVILKDVRPDEAFARAVINKLSSECDADAIGAIFISGDKMTPAVWVRAVESFVWESSCASGSLAAAVWLGRNMGDGVFTVRLKQPGGVLEAGIRIGNGMITEACIGGPVRLEETVERIIHI